MLFIAVFKPFNNLEKYTKFEIPEDAVLTVFEESHGIGQDSVHLKFTIKEEKLSELIKEIENANYYEVDISKRISIPHPENNCKEWDMDYNKLERYYEGNCVKGFFAPVCCSMSIFILKPEDNTVTVYFCYYG